MALFLVLIAGKVSAQFVFSGKIRSMAPVEIRLSDMADKILFQCTAKSGEAFTSSSMTISADYYKLRIAGNETLVFLENKPFTVKGFVNNADSKGSTLLMESPLYPDILAQADKQLKTGTGGWDWSRIQGKYPPVVLAGVVYQNMNFFINKGDVFRQVYEGLAVEMPDAAITKWIQAQNNRVAGFSEGATFANFALPDKEGKLHASTNFKDKLVLVDFWASWCAPCRVEMKSLQKIYQELKGDDLVFVSISIDEDRNNWLKALKEDNIPWLALWDDKQKTPDEMQKRFGFQQIPFIMLVDRQGKIVARHLRGENVKSEILKYR